MDNYFKGTRPELAKYIPKDVTKVLEIGCGEGEFLSNFDHSVEYWGVEPFIDAAEVARKKVFKVLNGSFEEIFDEIPSKYFDLIICNDVIEHMVDHDEFFENIKEKMLPNGKLMMSIPNVRYIYNLKKLLVDKSWDYELEGILDRTHLRFFTKKSLIKILKAHHYNIITLRGINTVKPKGIKKIFKVLLKILQQEDTFHMQFVCIVCLYDH